VEKLVENLSKTHPPRPFEEFILGEELRSKPRPVTQEQIQEFADLTGDFNPIHLDPEFARQTVMRGTIAHGLFCASLLAGMAWEVGLLGRNILALESSNNNFLQPVKPGDLVYGSVVISEVDADAAKRCGRVGWNLKLWKVNSGDGPDTVAVESHWSTLVFKREFLR